GVSLRNLELAWAVASSSWERPRFPSCPCRWVGHRSARNRRRVLGEAKAPAQTGPTIMTWRRSRRNAPSPRPRGEGAPKGRMRGALFAQRTAKPTFAVAGKARGACGALPSPLPSPRWRGARGTGSPRCARRLFLFGGDHHDHLPALEPGAGLDHDVLAQVGLDPLRHLPAQLLVAHLAATEADIDLDLVAVLQEAPHLAQLDLVAALVRHRPELHFLDLDLSRLRLGHVGLLLGLEPELAEVHDLAHRRIRVGLDLHQVEAFLLGHRKRLVARKHADHLAVAANHAHARDADFLVLAVLLVGGADIAIS